MTKPLVDPVKLGYINRGAPMDYLGTRQAHCPQDDQATAQDGFRTMASGWVGVGLPFGRKSTKGKLGAKADMWICTECHLLVEMW